jgi:valyl-tRNA synthetase
VTALLITGRPAFKRLVIHSPLQIVERALVERPDSSGELQDEARYLHRNRPRPMRRSFGNSVEPQTLIRRFGADALRLGLMFCLQHSGKHTVTASESNLRRGRRTIHRLNAITTKLLEWCRQKDTGAVSLYDLWLKARSAEISAAARASLARERPGGCALALVDWVSALSRYSRCVQTRVRSGSDIGAMPETLSACFSVAQIFTPLCPFILEGLNEDFIRLGAKVEDCSSTHEWLPPLVNEGSSTAGPLTLEISDPEAFTLLESNHEELEALCAKPVKLVAGAPEPGGQRSFRFTTRPSEAPSGHLEPH